MLTFQCRLTSRWPPRSGLPLLTLLRAPLHCAHRAAPVTCFYPRDCGKVIRCHPHDRVTFCKTLSCQATKAKLDKRDNVKLNICTSKETINRVKVQPKEWEKVFPNCMSDKRLISGIQKELLQLNHQETNNRFKNGQRTEMDISPVKIYKWPKSIQKDAQHNHQRTTRQNHSKLSPHPC